MEAELVKWEAWNDEFWTYTTAPRQWRNNVEAWLWRLRTPVKRGLDPVSVREFYTAVRQLELVREHLDAQNLIMVIDLLAQ